MTEQELLSRAQFGGKSFSAHTALQALVDFLRANGFHDAVRMAERALSEVEDMDAQDDFFSEAAQ